MRDELIDVVIIERFNIMEIPQIVIDMFSKTLNKSSRIKTFRCKSLTIRRAKPGVVHYDGEPILTDSKVEVSLVPSGLLCVAPEEEGVPDAERRIQNFFNEHFRNMYNKAEELIQENLRKSQRIQLLNKDIIRKLSGK